MSVDEEKNLGDEVEDRKTEQCYTPCARRLPPDGVEVMTKIDDEKGVRNEHVLVRRGVLWFTGIGGDAMYVYYAPTHWKPLESAKRPISIPSRRRAGVLTRNESSKSMSNEKKCSCCGETDCECGPYIEQGSKEIDDPCRICGKCISHCPHQ